MERSEFASNIMAQNIDLNGYRELQPCHLPHEEGLSDPQVIPIINPEVQNKSKTNYNEHPSKFFEHNNVFFDTKA